MTKKRWIQVIVRSLSVLFLCFAIEAGQAVYAIHGLKRDVSEMMNFKDRFKEDSVEKTCPKSQYESRYACFRDLSKPYFSSNLDTTRATILLSLGIMLTMKDKLAKRCLYIECTTEIFDLTLDVWESLLRSPAPSRYSLLYSHQMERIARSQFFATLLPKVGANMRTELETARGPASNSSAAEHIQKDIDRYEQMRPQIQAQGSVSAINEAFAKGSSYLMGPFFKLFSY